jgi:hypothetical protein
VRLLEEDGMSATSDIPTGLQFVQAPPAPTTFNVLLWGQPKSGKSTAAATAPGPILWINAEGLGALGYARKTAKERGTEVLEVMVDKRQRNAAQVLEEVYRHVRSGEEPQPATVVVDTLGKLRDALIEQFVAYCSPLRTDDGVRYFGQLVEGKGRTGLGDRSGSLAADRGIRELDLSEWLATYTAALTPDNSDVPFP